MLFLSAVTQKTACETHRQVDKVMMEGGKKINEATAKKETQKSKEKGVWWAKQKI